MSMYKESITNAPLQIAGGSIVPSDFRDEFPLVAEVLAGIAPTEADSRLVHPATITLFAELGRIKFVLKPKFGDRVAFGTLATPEKGLAALESEIAAGHFEWKRSSGRKSS